VADRVHVKHAADDFGLLFIDVQLHSAHRGASVLATPGRIFDGNIAIAKAFSTGLHALQCPTLLAPMDLFREADQELLVHHAVQCQERARCLFATVQALRDRVNEDAPVSELVVHAENVGEIPRQAGGVVNKQAVEWSGPPLGALHQGSKCIATREGRRGLSFIEANEFFNDGPPLVRGELAAPANLIFDRCRTLQV